MNGDCKQNMIIQSIYIYIQNGLFFELPRLTYKYIFPPLRKIIQWETSRPGQTQNVFSVTIVIKVVGIGGTIHKQWTYAFWWFRNLSLTFTHSLNNREGTLRKYFIQFFNTLTEVLFKFFITIVYTRLILLYTKQLILV